MTPNRIAEAALIKSAGGPVSKALRFLGRTALGAARKNAIPVVAMNALPYTFNTQLRGGYGNVSPQEAYMQHGIATGLGLALGSKRVRGGLINSMTPLKAVGPNLTKPGFSASRALSIASVPGVATLALPWYTDAAMKGRMRLGDWGSALDDVVSDVVSRRDKTEGPFKYMGRTMAEGAIGLDRGQSIQEYADQRIASGLQAGGNAIKPWLNDQAKSLAIQLGLAVPGTFAGLALGRALFPDDEKLTYAKRRNRELMRNIAQFAGSTALGAGGVYLANRLIDEQKKISG